MAQGYYYDGTPIGGASVNSNAPQSAFATVNKNGGAMTQYNSGNSVNQVMAGSIFDPLSKNYNATVAQSNGKISLSDLDHSTANGLSTNYNGTAGSGNPVASGGGIMGSPPSSVAMSGGYALPQGTYGTQSTSSIQDNINSLKQAQIDAAVSALGKSRDASLSNLGAEQSAIAPQYYDKRNAESTQNQLQGKNFAEYMAQRGSTNSGVSNQAQIANSVALQGGLGALNTQEMAANVDNARRVTDIGNAYQSDLVTAKSGAESQALQNLISQQNLDRTFNQAASQWQQGFNADQGQRTIQNGQWDQNFNADQTQRGVTNGQWNQNFNADQTQRGVQNNQWTQGFNADQTQRGVTNNQWDQNFNADQNYRMAQLAASQAKASGGGSGGPKAPTVTELNYQNKQNSQQSTSSAFQELQSKANEGWTRDQIIGYMYQNAGALMSNGVDVDSLASLAKQAFSYNGYSKTKDGYSDVNSPLDSQYK